MSVYGQATATLYFSLFVPPFGVGFPVSRSSLVLRDAFGKASSYSPSSSTTRAYKLRESKVFHPVYFEMGGGLREVSIQKTDVKPVNQDRNPSRWFSEYEHSGTALGWRATKDVPPDPKVVKGWPIFVALVLKSLSIAYIHYTHGGIQPKESISYSFLPPFCTNTPSIPSLARSSRLLAIWDHTPWSVRSNRWPTKTRTKLCRKTTRASEMLERSFGLR